MEHQDVKINHISGSKKIKIGLNVVMKMEWKPSLPLWAKYKWNIDMVIWYSNPPPPKKCWFYPCITTFLQLINNCVITNKYYVFFLTTALRGKCDAWAWSLILSFSLIIVRTEESDIPLIFAMVAHFVPAS